MIENLGADVAAARPRRDDDGRHPDAQTDRLAAHEFICGPGRRHRRRHMVKEAAGLIVREDEDCGTVNRRIGSQRIEQTLGQIRAVGGREGRMLRVLPVRNDPGHARERSMGDIGLEGGDDVAHQSNPAIVKRIPWSRVFILGEPTQRVQVEVIVALLIDFPANTCVLEPLGIRGPGEAARRLRVVNHRPAACAGGINRPAHQADPVWVSRPQDRAVVFVAEGVGLCQCVIKA